jgi:hypothetical protein
MDEKGGGGGGEEGQWPWPYSAYRWQRLSTPAGRRRRWRGSIPPVPLFCLLSSNANAITPPPAFTSFSSRLLLLLIFAQPFSALSHSVARPIAPRHSFLPSPPFLSSRIHLGMIHMNKEEEVDSPVFSHFIRKKIFSVTESP